MKAGIFGVIAVLLGAPGLAGQSRLRLHLPRVVLVEAETLRLGSIGVLRCDDSSLAAKAAAVTMGRAPWLREKIVINRRTILSRLASCGIPSGRVRITGAETVSVGRKEKVVPVKRLLSAAKGFLERNRPGPPGCTWRLSRKPRELVFPAGDNFALRARLAKNSPAGYAKVKVAAVSGSRELGVAEVLFKLTYPRRQAVAIEDIEPGTVISPKNAKVRVVTVDQPPPADWKAPFGMVAARRLRAGTIIRPGMLKPLRPAIIVRRNQIVTMRINGIGFVISTRGQALQDGRHGECIKVRNVRTRRVVTARVCFDGVVSPLIEEVKK